MAWIARYEGEGNEWSAARCSVLLPGERNNITVKILRNLHVIGIAHMRDDAPGDARRWLNDLTAVNRCNRS